MSLNLTKCEVMYFECVYTRNIIYLFPKLYFFLLLIYFILTSITVNSDAF
jgi:hypothetical protein